MEDVQEAPAPARRVRAWNDHVYAVMLVAAAIMVVGFLGAMLYIIARWAAHITGVMPL